MAEKSSMSIEHNFAFYLHEMIKKNTTQTSLVLPFYYDEDCIKELFLAQKKGTALPKHCSINELGICSVDFLKASYFQLPSDFQREYLDVIKQIMNHDTLIENNFFDKHFPTFNFAEDKLYKLWTQLCRASINFEARNGKKTFEEVIAKLEAEQASGKNTVFYYKNNALFTELDDRASAFLKVYGETEEEHKNGNNDERDD